jgi:hypothetical protein
LLVVTAQEQRDYEHSGVRFAKRGDPGRGGRADARVMCSGSGVVEVVSELVGVDDYTGVETRYDRMVRHVLCRRCAGLESAVRQSRREADGTGRNGGER